MPNRRNVRPGHTVVYPNRYKPASKVMKLVVIVLLLASAVLMALVTLGGWSKLQGLKPVNLLWIILYCVIAFYVFRWKRGMLPMAAALGMLLLILAVIAGTGVAGTSWFDRHHVGYASAMTIFSSQGLSDDILGLLTLLLAPVSLLLIVFAMLGFSQGWNVEQEVPEDEADQWRSGHPPQRSRRREESGSASGQGEPAPA